MAMPIVYVLKLTNLKLSLTSFVCIALHSINKNKIKPLHILFIATTLIQDSVNNKLFHSLLVGVFPLTLVLVYFVLNKEVSYYFKREISSKYLPLLILFRPYSKSLKFLRISYKMWTIPSLISSSMSLLPVIHCRLKGTLLFSQKAKHFFLLQWLYIFCSFFVEMLSLRYPQFSFSLQVLALTSLNIFLIFLFKIATQPLTCVFFVYHNKLYFSPQQLKIYMLHFLDFFFIVYIFSIRTNSVRLASFCLFLFFFLF